MRESQTPTRTRTGLLGRLILTSLAMVQAIISPRALLGALSDDATEATSGDSGAAAATAPPPPPDYHGQYAEDRKALFQKVNVAAVAFGVLLLLALEFTPMVVADDQLEDQLTGQVRSLVLVEGYVDRLDQRVEDGWQAWKLRVVEQVERALRKVIALDAYNQALAAAGQSAGVKSELPAFLNACAEDDPEVKAWVGDAQAIDDHWRDLVTRCIIEPIDADFDSEEQIALVARLREARGAVSGAVALARQEFPVSEGATAASLASSGPTEPSTGLQVQAELEKIETQIGMMMRIVETGANAAVQPPPRTWLARFAGTDGTLRSFRDNLLLAYTSSFGTLVADASRSVSSSNRGVDVAAQDPLLSSTLSFTVQLRNTEQQLADDVTTVMKRQEELNAAQDERAAEIQEAVPGVYQPVMAVARPKYFVLGFPLAFALFSAFFLVTYTVIRLRAADHGAGDSPLVTTLIFLGLALMPLAVLTFLFKPYDWPQFADSWWHWMHRGPLIGFGLVVLGCTFALLFWDSIRNVLNRLPFFTARGS